MSSITPALNLALCSLWRYRVGLDQRVQYPGGQLLFILSLRECHGQWPQIPAAVLTASPLHYTLDPNAYTEEIESNAL